MVDNDRQFLNLANVSRLENYISRLNLSDKSIAKFFGIDKRTVSRWRSSLSKTNFPKKRFVDKLQELDDLVRDQVLLELENINAVMIDGVAYLVDFEDKDTLLKYEDKWPENFASWRTFRGHLYQLTLLLDEDGIPWEIATLIPDSYDSWLSEKNRSDSRNSRAQWAYEEFSRFKK